MNSDKTLPVLNEFQYQKLKEENEQLHLEAAELRSLKQSITESGLLAYAPKREMSYHDKVVFSIAAIKAKLDKLKAIFSEAPDMYARELEIINS